MAGSKLSLWTPSNQAKEASLRKSSLLKFHMVSPPLNMLTLKVGKTSWYLQDLTMAPFKFLTIQKTKINNQYKDQSLRFRRLKALRLKQDLQTWIIHMITLKILFMSILHQSLPLRRTLKIPPSLLPAAKTPKYSCGTFKVNQMKYNLSLK